MSTWGPIKVVEGISAGLTTATTAYTSGDQLGTEITLTGVAGASNGFGVITGVSLVDDGDVMGAADLFIFSDTTVEASDNAAAAWSDADADLIVPGCPLFIPAPVDVGGARIAALTNLWIPFQSGSGHSNLYCDLVTRSANAVFVAADDLHVRVSVIQQT